MIQRALWRFLLCAIVALLHSSLGDAQIFNGGEFVAPTGTNFLQSDILPSYVAATTITSTKSESPISFSSTNTSTTSPPVRTTPPPPIPVLPYTTVGPGVFPVAPATPLPLPTSPALFPQNIATCSTCYGMFSTLSRCNVIANSNTFPITPNTTYESLLPFLRCICTFKALDAYPYCIDCFTKTQQLTQLNVLQANHLENYLDAFHQLCGVTHNGNIVPDAAVGMVKALGWMVNGGISLVVLVFSALLAGI